MDYLLTKMFAKPNIKAGTRIRLVRMNDPYTKMKPGTLGTVSFVDDVGTIHVDWDNGSKLGLIYGEDQYEVVLAP